MALFPTRTAAALALAGALLTAPAIAAPAEPGQSVTVRTDDLDLASDRGAKRLAVRVREAAQSVCGTADSRDISRLSEMSDCRKAAMASAAPQMQMALAAARNGHAYAVNMARPPKTL